MMKCENCQKDISIDSTKCPYCGSYQTDNKDSDATAEIKADMNSISDADAGNLTRDFENSSYCARCGKPVHYGYTLCPQCTSYVNGRTSKEEMRKQKDNSLTPVILIFLIVAVSVMLLTVSACIMFLNMGNNDAASQNTQEPVADAYLNVANMQGNTGAAESTDKKEKKYSIGYPLSSNHIMTWHEAASDAQSKGGYLACPNSQEEFNEICRKADEAGFYIIWLGAERSVGQSWNSVNWYNGSPMLYTNWFTGKISEPSYTDNGRDELYLTACKRNGVWGYNDSPSNIEYAFKTSEYAHRVGYILERDE